MADYIYLLQNRLTPSQWRALEAVREASRAHAMPVFLVGGAVRDLTSGSPVRDLDFAVQGDPDTLVGDLQGRGATLSGRSEAFGSVFLTFRGGIRVEVGPTLTVRYPKPGQPEVQAAAILDDLRRRDFTANAMAVSLNEGSYGLLLDPLNGTADIENRELRLVSPYGFIERPALLLRAARLTERLGWSLEERTQGRYETSKEEGHIQSLSQEDRGYELEELFHEEDAAAVLEHLTAEGWRDILFAGLQVKDADTAAIDEVRELLGQLESQGLHPDPSAVLFPLVTARLSEPNRVALKKLFLRQGFVQQVESLEARGKELAAQITSKSVAQPSDTWKLLMDSDAEVLLWLAQHSRSGAVQSKIKAFLKEWPQMRQRIPYVLMQEMRITPDLPGYDKLLDDLFFALIDGKLETTEATRAFLEPYSPPAPPQVAVRRRAAKATRGRGKRAQGAAAAERGDEEDRNDEQERDEDQDRDEEQEEDADESGSRKRVDANGDDEEADEADLTPVAKQKANDEEQAPAKSAAVSKKANDSQPAALAASEMSAAAPAKISRSRKSEAVVPPAAAEAKAAPAEDAKSADLPAVTTPAASGTKAARGDISDSKVATQKTSTQKGAAVKLSASAQGAKRSEPKNVPAKASAKAVPPAKSSLKKGSAAAAVATKAPGKTVPPAKRAAAPAKAVATKSVPPVKAVAKAPAKKTVKAAGKQASAKAASVPRKASPVKAAKKVAVKGKAKGRR